VDTRRIAATSISLNNEPSGSPSKSNVAGGGRPRKPWWSRRSGGALAVGFLALLGSADLADLRIVWSVLSEMRAATDPPRPFVARSKRAFPVVDKTDLVVLCQVSADEHRLGSSHVNHRLLAFSCC
jgi:hypothetical protein